jgi:hypothetical protein
MNKIYKKTNLGVPYKPMMSNFVPAMAWNVTKPLFDSFLNQRLEAWVKTKGRACTLHVNELIQVQKGNTNQIYP